MDEAKNEHEYLTTNKPVTVRNPVILPNKDLWLGFDPEGTVERVDNIALPEAADSKVTKEDVEKAVQASHSCPWCGEVSETDDQAREHIQSFHASALKSSAQQEREALEASHGHGGHPGRVPAGPIEGA